MKYRVTVLPQAKADVQRNAKWWADHHSADQAAHWLYTVRDQLNSLRTFPESHSLAAENDEFPYEIRDKLVGLGSRPGYRAVFTIKGDAVLVLTLRSGEQDRLTPDEVGFEV